MKIDERIIKFKLKRASISIGGRSVEPIESPCDAHCCSCSSDGTSFPSTRREFQIGTKGESKLRLS
jgi:hypothetical protein